MRAFHFSAIEEIREYVQENVKETHIIFSHYKNIVELGKQALPNVILCSTSGEFTKKGFSESEITGFSCDSSQIEAVEIPPVPSKSYLKLKNAYTKIQNNPNAFILLLCDGLSMKEELILTTLFCVNDHFKILGGSAGDSLEFRETYIYIGGRRVSNVALFFQMNHRTQILKENIYSPTGLSMEVSDCDPALRLVKTFNQRPAAEEFARLLRIPEEELPKYFMNHPLGRRLSNDIYIASPMKVNPDRSVCFYSRIRSKIRMELLEQEEPLLVFSATKKKMAFKPSFIFSVHCILRSLKFQEEKLWPKYSEKMLEITKNQCGFISYGEQYYKHHLNQTMTMLLVE